MFRKKSVWLYLLPGLVGLLAFYLVPFVWGIWFSLTDGTIDNRFVGFDNYLRVWQNEVFQLGLKNTIELSLLCAPVIFVLSFLLAGMLRKPIAGSTFYRNEMCIRDRGQPPSRKPERNPEGGADQGRAGGDRKPLCVLLHHRWLHPHRGKPGL